MKTKVLFLGIVCISTLLWLTGQEHSSYLMQVIGFSFIQATTSAISITALGLCFARVLWQQSEWFITKVLFKFLMLPFMVPAIIGVIGIVSTFGSSGFIGLFLGLETHHLFSLSGIVIAHLFFYLPLVTRMILHGFESINHQHILLAKANQISFRVQIMLIEWPSVKPFIVRGLGLAFILCMSSFSVILCIGGGPHTTTLPIAVYQYMIFDHENTLTLLLLILHLSFCFMGKLIIAPENQKNDTAKVRNIAFKHLFKKQKCVMVVERLYLLICFGFLFLPLSMIAFKGFTGPFLDVLHSSETIEAIYLSFALGIPASLLAVTLGLVFTYITVRHQRASRLLDSFSYTFLALPNFAFGLFIYYISFEYLENELTLYALIVFIHVVSSLPILIKTLKPNVNRVFMKYEKVSLNIGFSKIDFFRLILLPNLKDVLIFISLLGFTLAIGDMTAVAIFGAGDLNVLPWLIFEQLSQYKIAEATVTSTILMAVIFILFFVMERKKGGKNNDLS